MKLKCINTAHGLVPVDEDSYEDKKRLKLGEAYECDVKIVRNYKFLKKAFALLNATWSLMDERQQAGWRSKEGFRNYLTVAAAMLKWQNLFHCEINPFGRAVLDYWFPESKSYEDITKTDFTEWRGKVDVLTGGFPCQPFSYAGKRGGRDDDRYLWPEMLRAIGEIRPTWVIGENVVGITTMVEGGVLSDLGGDSSLFSEGDDVHRYELDQSFTIERICGDLERLGYSVQPMLIPAAAVGAPHRRDRIFIIAFDANSNLCDVFGHAGGDASTEEAERVSKRDQVCEPGDATKIRSEVREYASDTASDGRDGCPVHNGEERCPCGNAERSPEGSSDGFGLRGEPRFFGEQQNASYANGNPGRSEQDKGWEESLPRRQEGRRILGSTTRPCGGRTPSDTNGPGREEPVKPERCEDSEKDGAGVHDRTERPRRDGNVTNTEGEQHDGLRLNEPEDGRREGWKIGRSDCFKDSILLPENRWREFPTVSPVHRGNDGIPFDVDGLAVPPMPGPPTYGKGDPKRYPFSKWRTESLKAYGNAIVPQVMYRIFQAIQEVEDGNQG